MLFKDLDIISFGIEQGELESSVLVQQILEFAEVHAAATGKEKILRMRSWPSKLTFWIVKVLETKILNASVLGQ